MPTHSSTPVFRRQYARLTPQQQARFRAAVRKLIDDLREMEAGRRTSLRPGLRVRSLQASPGEYEMTWAPDGRAVFSWGEEQRRGLYHVVWRGIGDHGTLP